MYATSDYQAEHFQADGLESTVSQIKQEVLSIIVLIFVAYNFVPYLYLIVPFWYASAAYQVSLVEPWFVFWRDVVEPKYPW